MHFILYLVYPYERYIYQVAVASLNGFTVQAQEFAATHRISTVHMAENQIIEFANEIGRCMAVAVTNSGQLLFLFRTAGVNNEFSDSYKLHWSNPSYPWELRSGNQVYLFQLPKSIMKLWLENSTNNLELKKRLLIARRFFDQYGCLLFEPLSADCENDFKR